MQAKEEAKPWWQSKTIWVNLIMSAIALLTYIVDSELFDEYSGIFVSILTVLNTALRLITKSGIEGAEDFQKLLKKE